MLGRAIHTEPGKGRNPKAEGGDLEMKLVPRTGGTFYNKTDCIFGVSNLLKQAKVSSSHAR